MIFRHLNTYADRISVFPLYHQLNPYPDEGKFRERMAELMNTNYQLLAIYDKDKLVAISGYWIGYKLYCGKYLEPDNVVVDEARRSEGIGEMLHGELEKIARENGCKVMMLDAYLDNLGGHRFYERHGYVAKGYHFIKKL